MANNYLNRVTPCDASGTLEMHEEHHFAVKDEDGTAIGLGCFAFVLQKKPCRRNTRPSGKDRKTIKDRMNGKSAKSYEIEYRVRGKDGSIIHVRETAEPFSARNTGRRIS